MKKNMKYDSLSTRMKDYEFISSPKLIKKLPVIIRLDGKAFHTWTAKADKPYDETLHDLMTLTAEQLCEEIQGCKLAYVQSDEISLLLTDFETINTQPWFDYKLNKLVSISAAMATNYFQLEIRTTVYDYEQYGYSKPSFWLSQQTTMDNYPLFDSRAFNLPMHEVENYFIWRQQDATRNSIQMLAQSQFPHKELQNLSCEKLQEKLFQERKINWNDIPTKFKRGSCVIKEDSEWVIDSEIPIFTQDREYITNKLGKIHENVGISECTEGSDI